MVGSVELATAGHSAYLRGNSLPARRVGLNSVSIRYATTLVGAAGAHELLQEARLCDEDGDLPPSISKVAFCRIFGEYLRPLSDEPPRAARQPASQLRGFAVHAAIGQMETAEEALQKYAELASVMDPDLRVTVRYSSVGIHVSFAYSGHLEKTARREMFIEAFALSLHCVLRWMTGRKLYPARVRVSGLLHERDGSLVSGLGKLQERNGTGVTMIYDREEMTLPRCGRSYRYCGVQEMGSLQEIVDELGGGELDRQPDIVCALHQLIAEDICSERQAAHQMGVSTATLRRRLTQVGTTFREVSRSARRDRLRLLLSGNARVDDIAMDLGFSDRRSLVRACHQWLGMSPAAYRKAYGQGPARPFVS